MTAAISEGLKTPEIELDPSEAGELMAATQNVLRHYNIETTQKGADFIALAGVVSMITGTRIAAYRLRIRMEAEERKTQMAPNVVRMHQTPAPQSNAPAPTPRVEPSFETDNSGF